MRDTDRSSVHIIVLCSSSYRYKTAVSRFRKGLAVVDRLNPIAFAWKLGGKNDIGFGAEDVEKIDQRLIFTTIKDRLRASSTIASPSFW